MLHASSCKNKILDPIAVRSCEHILHVSLDLSSMVPLTVTLMFLDCQIAGRSRQGNLPEFGMCYFTDFEKNIR